MAGINQVSFAQAEKPQVQNQKRNYALPAVIVAGVGGAAGYSAHKNATAAIAETAAKCDETLIKNDLLKFWHWENGVPEASKAFFEDAVKGRLDFAKKCLESTKKFYKGHALQMGVVAAAATALVIGTASIVKGMMSNSKKEA